MKWIIAALLVFTSSVSPCFSDDAPKKELIVWGVNRDRALEASFGKFEVEHPGWTVVISSGSSAGAMDSQKLLTAIAGNSPPDTLIQDRFSVGEWVARDAFLPLDEFIAKSLADEKLAKDIFDAIQSGQSSNVEKNLAALTKSLERLGPSRQLDLAKSMSGGKTSVETARELLTLCQGLHPERFYSACWQEACFDRGDGMKAFGVPNGTDDRALFYNEDLLERAGFVDEHGKARPPRDWDELKNYAIKLTERDSSGRLIRLGFAPNFGNSWLYMYGFLNGGNFMSADGRTCLLNEPATVEALQYMVDVNDALGGVELVDSFQTTFQTNEFDPFLTGQIAMKIDTNWTANLVADNLPQMRFGVVPVPAPRGKTPITWSGGFSWVIPVGAKNAEMAFELIRFLSADRCWELQANVSSRYAASRGHSFVPGMAPIPEVNQRIYDQFVRDNADLPPRVKASLLTMNDLMRVSRFRPVTPVGQLLWDEHARAYEKASRHVYSPQEMLDRGTKSVQAQLDLIFKEKPSPLVDWRYPIAAAIAIAVVGALFIFFRFGKQKLLRDMSTGEAMGGYLFASPWLIGFAALTVGPIVASIVYSFCRYDVLHPARWVGVDNYRRMFSDDPLYRQSLLNTLFMLLGLPLGLIAGLGIAMLLNTKVRGMRIYRTIFYLPAIVPAVASSILWIWVLNPQMGLINSFLRMLGWSDPPLWLKSTSWIFGSKTAIVIMGLWSAGAGMIIWLAGLKGIPEHLYEAAEIDGAGPWKKFRHVTLPMLSPYIFFNMIIGVIGTLQIFTQAKVMTEGGPDGSTTFYSYYLFNSAFRYFNMGYASAMAWILFVIVLALTVLQMRLAKRWVYYESD